MKPLRQQLSEAIAANGLASEHIADLIADVVLHTIGNGTVKALKEENTRLKEQLEISQAAERLGRQQPWHCNGEKIIAWLDVPNRKSANKAFTAGLERQIAYRVEGSLSHAKHETEEVTNKQTAGGNNGK